MFAET